MLLAAPAAAEMGSGLLDDPEAPADTGDGDGDDISNGAGDGKAPGGRPTNACNGRNRNGC